MKDLQHCALTLIVLVLTSITLPGRSFATPELPPSEDKPTAAEVSARVELAKSFPGRIVFDTNRGNGFGIYTVDVLGEKFEPLADSAEHEMYPDVSPDGKWVIYSRGDTLDKNDSNEIWMVPSTGGESKKIASDGMFPTFSQDGKSIYFERGRERVMKLDLATKKETEIFPKGFPGWPKKAQIVKPHVSPDGTKIAFISQKPRRWSSWYVDLKANTFQYVGGGCEPSWFENGNKIAWVSGVEALERSSITSFDLKTKTIADVQDADAPRGHEYFPTITKDDHYLLFGAARPSEHKPTTANYQLFVKDLKSGKVTRITFDPYTNRWPKLLPAVVKK